MLQAGVEWEDRRTDGNKQIMQNKDMMTALRARPAGWIRDAPKEEKAIHETETTVKDITEETFLSWSSTLIYLTEELTGYRTK